MHEKHWWNFWLEWREETQLIILFILGILASILFYYVHWMIEILLFGRGLIKPPDRIRNYEQPEDSIPGKLVQGSRGFIHYILIPPMNNTLTSSVENNNSSDNEQSFMQSQYSVKGMAVDKLPDNLNGGSLVVIVHGFAGSSHVFLSEKRSAYVGALCRAGKWVLTFDCYGHGHSDAPDTEYTCELFVEQLVELCILLNIRNPFTLVGYSMGGSTSVIFAKRFPHLVSKLILQSPSVVEAPLQLSLRIALRIPIFREVLAYLIIPHIGECKNHPGAIRASFRLLLSRIEGGGRWSCRGAGGSTLDILKEGFDQLNLVHVLWGENDTVVRFDYECSRLQKVAPYCKVLSFVDADHMCFADGPMSARHFFRDTLVEWCTEPDQA